MAAAAPSSSSSSSSTLEDAVNTMRLRSMISKVATKTLWFLFNKESENRPLGKPLLDFYCERKNMSKTKWKEGIMRKHIDTMKKDPEGKSFDVTLLCLCLRKGSDRLAADDEEDKWKKGDLTIEACITSVKLIRNFLAHEDPSLTLLSLMERTTQLRDLLKKILQFAEHLYSIPTPEVDTLITEMCDDINRYLCESLLPQNFKEFERLSTFPDLSKYVNQKGVAEALVQYDKYCEGEVNTLNHLVDLRLPLEDIFTEMKMRDHLTPGKEKDTTYHELFVDQNQKETNSLIVLYGYAGVGKTTLTKSVLREWKFKNMKAIKYIDTYRYLLKVECRNKAIKSFNELLRHLMPETAKIFHDVDHLKYVVCAHKVLVIIDGIDEVNSSSALLFEEILYLKRTFGIGVIATTRPEKLEYIEQKAKSLNMNIKYIRLVGIPVNKRDVFVSRYFSAIEKKYGGVPEIKGLLDYLQRTGDRLSELWLLPYNLALITTLFAFNIKGVVKINSGGELYNHMMKLYVLRLRERLQSSAASSQLPDSQVTWIINCFLNNLAKESIIALMNNEVNLSSDVYDRLKRDCINSGVPIEEMIGAFLKKIPGTDFLYGYAHKGILDYFCAYYIWGKITGKIVNSDVDNLLQKFDEFLRMNAVPAAMSQSIMRFSEEELTKRMSVNTTKKTLSFDVDKTETDVEHSLITNNVPEDLRKEILMPVSRKLRYAASSEMTSSSTRVETTLIRDILEEVHNGPVPDLNKFQNTFQLLIGMFYVKKDDADGIIEDDIKREALLLLRDSGIKDTEDWLKILMEIRIDEYIAAFISRETRVLNGIIKITDATLFAYISLLQALQPSMKQSQGLMISLLKALNPSEKYLQSPKDIKLQVKGDISDVGSPLLESISKHQIQVTEIWVTQENIASYTSLLRDLKSPLGDPRKVNIMLDITKEQSDVVINMWTEVKKKKFNVSHVYLPEDFRQPGKLQSARNDAIAEMLQLCHVEGYIGRMTPHLSIPVSMKRMYVSVGDTPSYLHLRRFLDTKHRLEGLSLAVNIREVEEEPLNPIPKLNRYVYPNVYLPDIVTDDDIRKASQVAKRLHPIVPGEKFGYIYFPRLRLKGEEIKGLLSCMKKKGVNINNYVVFPSSCRPSSRDLEEELEEFARTTLQCKIAWGKPDGADVGSIYDMDSW